MKHPPLGTQCQRGRQLVPVWGDRCALKFVARPSSPAGVGKKGTRGRGPGQRLPHEQTLTRACHGAAASPRTAGQLSAARITNCLQLSALRAHLVPLLLGCPLGSRICFCICESDAGHLHAAVTANRSWGQPHGISELQAPGLSADHEHGQFHPGSSLFPSHLPLQRLSGTSVVPRPIP